MTALCVRQAVCVAVSVAAAVVALTGCATPTDVSDDRFIRFFDELAFGSGVDSDHANRLVRWEGSLRFQVRGDASFRTQAVQIMAELGRMADLADAPEQTNDAAVILHQEPAGVSFPINRDRVDCYIHYKRRGPVIVGADIHIAAREPQRVELCLYHEVFHLFGLGHSGAIASVMSPFHGVSAPTRWDFMAARFILSDKVNSGMLRQRVLDTLGRKLPSLRAMPG